MAINNLGNGSGFIYITDTSDNILSNIVNNAKGKKAVLKDALINSVLANDSTSFFEDRKYYISTSGSEGNLTGAIDITKYITNVGLNNRFISEDASVSSGIITYTRGGSIQRLRIDTQSDAATDNLIYLRETNGYITDGDIVILVGENSSRVTSVLDANSSEASTENGGSAPTGVGYFELDSNTEFDTNTGNYTLMLQYNATVDAWYEINRAPGAVLTDEKIREAGINFPKKGVYLISSVTAGGSFTPTVDVTAGVIYVSGTHDISAGNYTINKPTGGTPREGDEFTVVWEADVTTTGVINVFSVALESADYGSGSSDTVEIKTRYINGGWKDGTIIKDTKAVSEAKEDVLGNPTGEGQFLTSTTGGVRSWSTLSSGLKTKTFTFDTSVTGIGSVGINVLTASDDSTGIPARAIIDSSLSIIEGINILESGSATTIKIGIKTAATSGGSQATDEDFFLTSQQFDAAPFDTVYNTGRCENNLGRLFTSEGYVSVSIGVADLTAGKFNVIVAYYES